MPDAREAFPPMPAGMFAHCFADFKKGSIIASQHALMQFGSRHLQFD
jgi:hypothetical protein